jgi:hypothetical protein
LNPNTSGWPAPAELPKIIELLTASVSEPVPQSAPPWLPVPGATLLAEIVESFRVMWLPGQPVEQKTAGLPM